MLHGESDDDGERELLALKEGVSELVTLAVLLTESVAQGLGDPVLQLESEGEFVSEPLTLMHVVAEVECETD